MFRWIAVAVFVSTLAISARRRWQARRASGTIPRSAEPLPLIVGRLVVALPLFAAVLAYLVNPRWMSWATAAFPSWARWAGVALGVSVVPWAAWVLTTLGANVSETVLTKPTHQLVVSGPYRWIRHPLYVGGIALFVGIGLMAANWFILTWAGIAAIAVRLVVIPREDAHLLQAFGDVYSQYQARTPALLPWSGRTRA